MFMAGRGMFLAFGIIVGCYGVSELHLRPRMTLLAVKIRQTELSHSDHRGYVVHLKFPKHEAYHIIILRLVNPLIIEEVGEMFSEKIHTFLQQHPEAISDAKHSERQSVSP